MSTNQVTKDPVQVNDNAEYKEGEVLDDPITSADELGAYENPQIPEGEDEVPGDVVKGDKGSGDLSEVSQGNIIEGTRSTRGEDLTKGYRELDAVVDDALNANGGDAISE